MELTTDWTFPTLAYVWEYRNGAIVAGAAKLDSLTGTDRERSVAALADRVRGMVTELDDGWLVTASFWMVEDLYKSFFRGFSWGPGVHDYIAATAAVVVEELARRGLVLHYVVDATQGEANLVSLLAYLPGVFAAAGLAVVGPQLVATDLLMQAEEHPPSELKAIQRYRDEGHAIADEVITRWHDERRSSVYLNLDFDDDLPGLPLDAALSPDGEPGTIFVFRNDPPAAGSSAYCGPPPGVEMPPGVPARPAKGD